jgi:hypothetical protein
MRPYLSQWEKRKNYTLVAAWKARWKRDLSRPRGWLLAQWLQSAYGTGGTVCGESCGICGEKLKKEKVLDPWKALRRGLGWVEGGLVSKGQRDPCSWQRQLRER